LTALALPSIDRIAAPSAQAEGLPGLPIAPEWKLQQRLWGHSFHPMCSYLAAFPAALAHAFIARYSRPGDVVLDPFSGRGTTPLQACAEGRTGVGNDLNPLAFLLTAAKVDPPDRNALAARLVELRWTWWSQAARWMERSEAGGDVEVPPEVAVAFHPWTLSQLLFLRETLDLARPADRFVAATTVGILHGKSATYLSGVMPNTFSMGRGYVRDYAARTGFAPESRDVFDALETKVRRLFRQAPPPVRGIALAGDARDASGRVRAALRSRALPERARLVVTSPPYLRVVKYGACNWLRLWFLGIEAAEVDAALDDAHHLDAYLSFMRAVLVDLRAVLADDAVVVLVIGDVERDRGRPIRGGVGLAGTVWEASAEPVGYRLAGIASDEIAPHRKMTKIWGAEAGNATQIDRILVVAPSAPGRQRALAGLHVPVDWTWPRRGPGRA
jgi:site-specific DNA-methyltransferase (adenine-specific)